MAPDTYLDQRATSKCPEEIDVGWLASSFPEIVVSSTRNSARLIRHQHNYADESLLVLVTQMSDEFSQCHFQACTFL